MARPVVEALSTPQLPEFAEFLHRQLDSSRTPAQWADGLNPPWMHDAPNHGFVLRDEGRIVGGIGALYASRPVAGRMERFCNITSWCVLDSYRQHSLRLAMAVVGQKGYHFTDFSPTKTVSGTLQFLKFKPLDDRQVVALNLPWPSSAGLHLVDEPAALRRPLDTVLRQAYDDHRGPAWLRHVFIEGDGACCHVIYKRRRFKGLPAASLLYASDPALLRRAWRALGGYLLSRGMVSTRVEWRLLGGAPWPSHVQSGFVPKVFLSDTLDSAQIDCLYSEQVVLNL
jgi:hypothetical protein